MGVPCAWMRAISALILSIFIGLSPWITVDMWFCSLNPSIAAARFLRDDQGGHNRPLGHVLRPAHAILRHMHMQHLRARRPGGENGLRPQAADDLGRLRLADIAGLNGHRLDGDGLGHWLSSNTARSSNRAEGRRD